MPEPAILSLQNPRVKAAVALRSRRERDRTGLTLVDGGRECLRALDAGVEITAAFVCRELVRTPDAHDATQRLEGIAGPVFDVPSRVLEKVAFGDRADGVVLVIRRPATSLARITLSGNPLVAVVEGIEKPGNLGAILRSADAAGVDALVAADPLTDLFNPNAIRASIGTIFTVPIAAASSSDVVAWLRARAVRPVAARVDAPRAYTEMDLTRPTAIVLGSEAAGLSDAWRTIDVEAVRLPMLGTADSLNVAAAAAVLFYEAQRQRAASGAFR